MPTLNRQLISPFNWRNVNKTFFFAVATMKKTFTLCVLLFVSCLRLSAQGALIDSLENLLTSATDTTRVNLLNRLSEIYARGSNQKAAPYSTEALTLSEKLNFQSGIATSYRTTAIAYFFNIISRQQVRDIVRPHCVREVAANQRAVLGERDAQVW